LKIELNCEHI